MSTKILEKSLQLEEEKVVDLDATEEELRQNFFHPDLKRASIFTQEESDLKTECWCELSERRLFKKLLEHKPAGVMKHYHMAMLHLYMNNVYEDEDTDFEDLLPDDDLQELMNRRQHGGVENLNGTLIFKPRYRIRPTVDEIRTKLKIFYDMDAIERNESVPEMLLCQNDFFLPDGEFGELLAKREEANQKQIGRKEDTHHRAETTKAEFASPEAAALDDEIAQPPPPPQSVKRRKRAHAERSWIPPS